VPKVCISTLTRVLSRQHVVPRISLNYRIVVSNSTILIYNVIPLSPLSLVPKCVCRRVMARNAGIIIREVLFLSRRRRRHAARPHYERASVATRCILRLVLADATRKLWRRRRRRFARLEYTECCASLEAISRDNYCSPPRIFTSLDTALFAPIMYVYTRVVTICKCDNLYATHPDTLPSFHVLRILDISRRIRLNIIIEHGSLANDKSD